MTQSRYQTALSGVNANSSKEADFSNQELSEAQVEAVAQSILTNSSLVAVNFNQTQIGVEGIQKIVKAMQHHPSLWRVRFSAEDLKEVNDDLRTDLKHVSMENFKKFRQARDQSAPSAHSFGLFKPAVLLAATVATGLAVTAMSRFSTQIP